MQNNYQRLFSFGYDFFRVFEIRIIVFKLDGKSEIQWTDKQKLKIF
jgi:hypothetical protein